MPEIRHRGPLGLLLAALLLGGGAAVAVAKPLPPLSIMWQVDSTLSPEGTHAVALTLEARDGFPELAVAIELPRGFTLVEGEARWSGHLERDSAVRLDYVVHGPGPGRITARIEGNTASNVHFSRAVAVHVPEATAQEKGLGPSGPPRAGTPGVREYRSP